MSYPVAQKEAAEKRRIADFDMPTLADMNIPQEYISNLSPEMTGMIKQVWIVNWLYQDPLDDRSRATGGGRAIL